MKMKPGLHSIAVILACARSRRAKACALALVTAAAIAMPACNAADDASSAGPSIDGGKAGSDAKTGGDAVAGSCLPGDVTSFTGGDYHPPLGAYQGKCDDDMLAAYVDCKKNTNPVSCNTFATGLGAACLACIETPVASANWGPVVVDASGTHATLNLPGCLALAYGEGTSSTGCGGTLQKELNCEVAACGTNCATAPANDLQSCELASIGSSGGCSAFASAEIDACSGDGGPAAEACLPQTYPDGGPAEDLYDYAGRLAAYFCGFGAADGGTLGDGG